MITRKLGALLRGKATPFQIVLACVLGGMLGFAPAVGQAPGLYLFLIGALLVLNANLGLALLVAGGARLLSYVAAPLSFSVGQFLLDGPTSSLARTMVNAPVLAWCGLQYYAVAGGLALGALLGIVLGLALASLVRGVQRRIAAAAQNPSRVSEIASKPLARALMWVFFGGAKKGATWDQILERKVGNPIRVPGVVLLALLGGGLYFAHRWITRAWARDELVYRLEAVNGATADVGGVELDLKSGRIAVANLALADAEDLTRDAFRAGELAADFDQVDILRRRVHMAELVISGAKSGALRDVPGKRSEHSRSAPEPAPAPGGEGTWDLEQVLAKAELWKARLARAKHWIERLAPERSDAGSADGSDPTSSESLKERAARLAREAGWFRVEATHLVDQTPTFHLSALRVDGLIADWLPGKELDLVGSQLSTQPWLLDAPAQLELKARDGSVGFAVDLAPVSRAGGAGGLRFHWKGLAVDEVLSEVRFSGEPPLRGGTLDLELAGSWAEGKIGVVDLPLKVTFRNTTIAIPGAEPTTIAELALPIGISGPLDRPRVHFETERFAKALAAAGKEELANRVRAMVDEKTQELKGELEGELEKRLDELKDKAGVELPDNLGELGGDLGKKVQDGAKDALGGDLGKKAEDGAKDLLKGVLGGKKKDESKKPGGGGG